MYTGRDAWGAYPTHSGLSVCTRALWNSLSRSFHQRCQYCLGVKSKGSAASNLGSNHISATYELCDLEHMVDPLWASFSSSIKEGIIIVAPPQVVMRLKWTKICIKCLAPCLACGELYVCYFLLFFTEQLLGARHCSRHWRCSSAPNKWVLHLWSNCSLQWRKTHVWKVRGF